MEQDLKAFADWFRDLYGLKEQDPLSYSSLVLAYIGDAVYELVIRSYTVGLGNRHASDLHGMSAKLVNAHFQSQMIEIIKPELTEEEWSVYKRGRNTKAYSKAKNATMADYRRATGCEALIGYLFLSGRYERLVELIHDAVMYEGDITGDSKQEKNSKEIRDQEHTEVK